MLSTKIDVICEDMHDKMDHRRNIVYDIDPTPISAPKGITGEKSLHTNETLDSAQNTDSIIFCNSSDNSEHLYFIIHTRRSAGRGTGVLCLSATIHRDCWRGIREIGEYSKLTYCG